MAWSVNDDSIRLSQACVSISCQSTSFSLEESLLPSSFSACLSGMIQGLLVSLVLISSGEMESAWQLVSSEMALTGRFHSDNNNPLSFSSFFSSLTSFSTQVCPSFPLFLLLFFFSCILLPLFYLSVCL